MAINNTTKTYSKMEFPLAMQRQDAFALDPTGIWASFEAAHSYAKNDPTAYVGQIIAVVSDGISKQYQIKNTAGDLEPIGGIDELRIATDDEAAKMLDSVFSAV